MDKKQIIKLKVVEAIDEYIGKNIITLDIDIKQKLNIISGDVIEIKGNSKTVAQVWPEKKTPNSENFIRMDKYIRKNAGVSIGDYVTIKKIIPKTAQEIVLTPLKEVDLLSKNYDLVVKKNFLGRPFMEGNTVMVNVFGAGYFFNIDSIKPKESAVVLSEETKLIINQKPKPKLNPENLIGYEDVGGLKKEIDKVREMVELPFKRPQFFNKLNVTPPKGILLFGTPGTGKTLLAKALSNELKANFIPVEAPQIMAKYVGEAEERLRKIFKKAKSNTPAIIFIDEIDAIAPKRDGMVSEVEKRVVAQLLSLMDGVDNRGDIIVIGATNRGDDLDPALRRPGRFDREINIGVPDESSRYDILKIHTRNVAMDKKVNLKKIAKKTYGYVGADLAALVKEAAIFAIKEYEQQINVKEDNIDKVLEKLKISSENFNKALDVVQPSGLREVFVQTPDIDYSDIGALDDQKQTFKDIINVSLNQKDLLSSMNLKALKKVLIYGSPGTGKTMFVKATAKEFGLNFIYVKGPEVFDKWVGESEKAIRNIFKKAKEVSPCILFFDEIDSLTTTKNDFEKQTKVLDQLLTELDNIKDKDILFVSSSNRPDLIDKSFLRSGRIDKIIEFKVPDKKDRKKIIDLLLLKKPTDKIDKKSLIEKTDGFTGADLELLITDATLIALKENKYKQTKLKQKHIDQVLDKIKPKVDSQSEMYDSFKKDISVAKYIQ